MMHRHRIHRSVVGAITILLAAGLAPRARPVQAGWIRLSTTATPSTVKVNDSVEITVTGDIQSEVLGFGFDLLFDDALFRAVNVNIAKPFLPLTTPDGDGLAGLAYPQQVVGENVKLATVTLIALAPGQSTIGVGVTSADSTEGFPEYGRSWAQMLIGTTQTVTVKAADSLPGKGDGDKDDDSKDDKERPPVTPEPATMAMIVLGMAWVRRSNRSCRL